MCPGFGLLSWLLVAQAAEISVLMDTPVMVKVDGRIATNPSGGTSTVSSRVDGGRHLVQVSNLLGQPIAETYVELNPDQRVRLRYSRKQITLLAVEALAASQVTPVINATGGSPPPTTSARQQEPAVGSLEVVGFDGKSGAVFVDGVRVIWDPALDSFPAIGLPAGPHDLRVEKDRRLRHQGSVQIQPNHNLRCLLEPRGESYALECFQSRPMLGAGAEGGSSGLNPGVVPPNPPAGPAGGLGAGAAMSASDATVTVTLSTNVPVETAPPTAPPVTDAAPVNVEWILKDAMDMCNIYVDGEKVLELRTGDAKGTVVLKPGLHTVEIKSFTEFDTWHRGLLTVTGPDAMKVGFGEDEPVEVYNRPDAWAVR